MTTVPESRTLLQELRAEMERLGLSRKRPVRVLGELGVHVAIATLGVLGYVHLEGPLARGAGLAVMVVGLVGISTNSHTSAHGGTSDRRWLNLTLAWLGFTFLAGCSLLYWRDKHNGKHHGSPNVEGVDPDHEFTPFFALARTQLAGLLSPLRRLQPAWGLLLPLSFALMLPQMLVLAAVHAVRQLRGPRRMLASMDLLGILLSIAFWWVAPLAFLSPLEVVVLNAVRLVGLSLLLVAIFAPAHLPAEAAFYARGAEPADYAVHQLATTLNFRAGPARFFLSGLEHQIEHHLFPGVAHVHLRRLAPVVREACRRRGLPYRELSWGRALVSVATSGVRLKETVSA